MAALIQKIGRLAHQAFNRDTRLPVHKKTQYLKELEMLMGSVSAADLGIDPDFLAEQVISYHDVTFCFILST